MTSLSRLELMHTGEKVRLIGLDQAFREGDLPLLEGGFSFKEYDGPVTSYGHIPHRMFADYIRARLIPVVPEHNPIRIHDLVHVDNFIKMMRIPGFADILQGAAEQVVIADDKANSEVAPGLEYYPGYRGRNSWQFIMSVDHLGDSMQEASFGILSALNEDMARQSLKTIVTFGADANTRPERIAELTSDIWSQLGLSTEALI
jgi:hypothetical protein